MNTDRIFSGRAQAVASAALLSALLWMPAAHAAPPDPVSNPDKLDYSVVRMDTPDYDAPFQREGEFSTPDRYHAITPGLSAAQVTQLLGQPLDRSSGAEGEEWNYNVTLRMPASENYLVCQYKVVFDGQEEAVKDLVWRRHQCLDIVNGTAPR